MFQIDSWFLQDLRHSSCLYGCLIGSLFFPDEVRVLRHQVLALNFQVLILNFQVHFRRLRDEVSCILDGDDGGRLFHFQGDRQRLVLIHSRHDEGSQSLHELEIQVRHVVGRQNLLHDMVIHMQSDVERPYQLRVGDRVRLELQHRRLEHHR